jgi:hypothetical protein
MEVDTGSTISWLHGVNIWDQGQKSGKHVKIQNHTLENCHFQSEIHYTNSAKITHKKSCSGLAEH